jgi:hypothetical protein
MTRKNFQFSCLILGIFWLGLVWSAKNLNKLALGGMSRENFSVSCLILGIFLALYGLVVWPANNLNKLALGDMTRQNFLVSVLTLQIFCLGWQYGLVCKTGTSWRLEI